MITIFCYKFLTNTFRHICFVVAVALVSWCFHEYELDQDITQIVLRKYHQRSDDIHPSITVCYTNPYQDQNFEKYHKNNSSPVGVFQQTYRSLLEGNRRGGVAQLDKFRQSIASIDYDEVTIGFKHIIDKFYIKVTVDVEHIDVFNYNVVNSSGLALNVSDSSYTKLLSEFNHIEAYMSVRQPNLKCFTLDVPFAKGIDIREVGMRLNASIFPWGFSPSQMYFTLTYPQQILRTSLGNRIKMPERRSVQCYQFKIHVGSMEVFKRRNKENEKCNKDWTNHDSKHLRHVIETVGCQPKHWKTDSVRPHCTSPEQYNRINNEIYKKDGFMPPCRSVETLSKITQGFYPRICGSYSYLDLSVYLDEESHYKEIVLVPAYTFQSLIGNAGNCQ